MVSRTPKKKTGLAESLHAHGCKRCAGRYQDACTTPAVDDLCTICRGEKPGPLQANRLPRACCRELSRLVTKDEIKTYALAGTRLWFICRTCARTHPFNPLEKT